MVVVMVEVLRVGLRSGAGGAVVIAEVRSLNWFGGGRWVFGGSGGLLRVWFVLYVFFVSAFQCFHGRIEWRVLV